MAIELFVLTWGVYPRRVIIYLAEKGLLGSPEIKITPVTTSATTMTAPGKPPGSVPILSLGGGRYIKQSIAILEYVEDVCDAACAGQQDQNTATMFGRNVYGSMRGKTPEKRARVREMVGIADEAMTHFSVACRKGTAMFVARETQNAAASAIAMELCMKSLKLLETYYQDDHRFDDEILERVSEVTIADCVLFSLLQFAKEFYGRDLAASLPHLKQFYLVFEDRESARIGEDFYPSELKPLARHWIANSQSTFEVLAGKVQMLLLLVPVICILIWRLILKNFWHFWK